MNLSAMIFFFNFHSLKKNILSILIILVISGISIADENYQGSCESFNPLKQAYFGDLHIHTGLSADAMLFGTTNRPDDAYAFAQGKSISIQKLTDSIDSVMIDKLNCSPNWNKKVIRGMTLCIDKDKKAR